MTLNYVCRASKARRNGLSPIELSVIIDGNRSIITLDRQVHHTKFNAVKQTVKGDKEINDYLDLIRKKCYNIQTELIKINRFDIDTFVYSFKNGIVEREDTLLKLYDKHNKLYKESVAVGKVDNAAYYKYMKNRDRIAEYLQTIKKTDIKLTEITPLFIENFQNYCLKSLKTNTANKQLKMLKKILAFAVKEGILVKNPFQLVLREEKLDYDVLNKEEINKLLGSHFLDSRIEQIRDCFVFQCYTGLAYTDMANLTAENIENDVIVGRRKKTDVQYVVPLLPIAKQILEKYEYKLPVISNQKYNQYLKILGDVTGLGKQLHSHLARHTFACLLLNSGVDMKTISRTLGHSSMKITEKIYASMNNDTVISNIRKALI